jgi:hypothetical protein
MVQNQSPGELATIVKHAQIWGTRPELMPDHVRGKVLLDLLEAFMDGVGPGGGAPHQVRLLSVFPLLTWC